jgi:hypothetical protein
MYFATASVCLSAILLLPASAPSKAVADDATEPVRKFVQSFYDYYPLAKSKGYHDPRWRVALDDKAAVFSSELLAALSEEADHSGEFVFVDWDPLLNDDGDGAAGDRYVVTHVTRSGARYSAEVGLHRGTRVEPRIIADLECQEGVCKFVNVRDPRDRHYDLMRCLRLLQEERRNAKEAKREARMHVDEKLKEGELARIDDESVLRLVRSSDLSYFWTTTDSDYIYGFIGDNYQRLHIHYSLVRKIAGRNDEYEVRGKTRYRGRVTDFAGTAKIVGVGTAWPPNPPSPPSVDLVVFPPDDVRGAIEWKVSFRQEPQSRSSATIEGSLTSQFYVDFRKHVRLDDRMGDADGYSNNEFIGVWRSHDGSEPEKCHWGDFRIPDSGDLDGGAGEFYPNDEYVANGWQELVKEREAGDAVTKKPWWK